jgi:hypothetical protein
VGESRLAGRELVGRGAGVSLLAFDFGQRGLAAEFGVGELAFALGELAGSRLELGAPVLQFFAVAIALVADVAQLGLCMGQRGFAARKLFGAGVERGLSLVGLLARGA